ncbi:M3 family oligoendopeptidase, partial [Candidatus Kaiserbacteria bacterium]|nr:M3 family oligoendopeptidase [Candidatus Kaiserbacteria bacterium]
PYSATVLAYQDEEVALERLLKAVTGTGFKLSHKFYKLKARYHGVEKLEYSQRNESAGKSVNISFTQAVTICRDVFYSVNRDYGTFFDTMLENGQIDFMPKSGKTGGAFMSAQNGHPINVMLNHLNNFPSLETLAHEMGHAIHAMRSNSQSPFYSNHSIVTAETASTLFENLVFDAVFAQATDAEKAVLLHDRILRDVSTIQRQIAFFNAELEIHNTIYKQGGMNNEDLRACMQKHLQSYLGSAVNVTSQDGYTYVYVGHLRYGFYVYSYAYGLMMSTIMANNYRLDNHYAEKIDLFLSLG